MGKPVRMNDMAESRGRERKRHFKREWGLTPRDMDLVVGDEIHSIANLEKRY